MTSIRVSFQVAVIMCSDISIISFKKVYYRFCQFNVFGKTCPNFHGQKQRVDLAGKHANVIYNDDLEEQKMSSFIRLWNCPNSVIYFSSFYCTRTGENMNSKFDVLPTI